MGDKIDEKQAAIRIPVSRYLNKSLWGRVLASGTARVDIILILNK